MLPSSLRSLTIRGDLGLSKWGYPKLAEWFISWKIGKSIYQWMIWGYPHFRKPPIAGNYAGPRGNLYGDLMVTSPELNW